MMKKNIYIKPLVSFEEVEQESALCDISVYGPGQGSGYDEDDPRSSRGAKGGFWETGFGDPFVEPTEEATSDFVFNNDLNW